MGLDTLAAMALGGLRDHLGGGFHRYSVDAEWRVPHFEKMLYDQAQLVLADLEASQAARDTDLADVAGETLDYVRRELTDPTGGFYSAEDADSIPPEQAGRPEVHPEGLSFVRGGGFSLGGPILNQGEVVSFPGRGSADTLIAQRYLVALPAVAAVVACSRCGRQFLRDSLAIHLSHSPECA